MSDYRAQRRGRGLRPIELWVHDTRATAFRDRLRREADIVRQHFSSREGEAFAEAALAEVAGWE